MSWYRSGTITVTNGSTTVTGSGTSWIANAAIGEGVLAPDNRIYEIVNIASDISITLGSAYLGSNSSGQSYVVVPTQSYIRDLATQAATLINNYSTIYNTVGQGKFAEGTLGAPAITFQTDTDTGFYHSASNEVTFVAGGVAQFKYNTSGLVMINGGGFVNLTTSGNTTLGDAAADTVTINGTTTHTAPAIVSVNTSSDALRITQTGSGNALLVEDSANPDATPFVVSASGQVGIGIGSSAIPGGAGIYMASDGTAYYELDLLRAGDNGGASSLEFRKTRGTVAAPTVVANGDSIANMFFRGYDGAGNIQAASIVAAVDGTPGTNDMPGRLVFSTTADGASSPTERMRIDSAGRVGIGGVPSVGYNFVLSKNITGATAAFGSFLTSTVQSDVTTISYGYACTIGTQAAAFTLANSRLFQAAQGTIGAGSTITNQVGFYADSSLTGATNNYGFQSNIASGTGRYNFYAAGTASNYFEGSITSNSYVEVTTNTVTGAGLRVKTPSGSGSASIIQFTNNPVTAQWATIASVAANTLTFNDGGNVERMRMGSAGVISLGAAPGAESLRVTPVASAVNYVNVTGAVTTGYPSIVATGSDTNIGMVIQTKGTSPLVGQANTYQFQNTSAAMQFYIANTASAVNYLQVTGNATGLYPSITATGSDATVGLVLNTKGGASQQFYTGNQLQFTIAHTASAVNYLQVNGNIAGAAPFITAQGSDTNVGISLVPKGNNPVQVLGNGQTVAGISTSGALGSALLVSDTGSGVGNGGSVVFGAASGAWRFAAIKSNVTSGSNNTQGDLFFLTRRASTDANLTAAAHITSAGVVSLGSAQGSESLRVTPVAGAVNYLDARGAVTGAPATLIGNGSDTNVGMYLAAKGTGFYQFTTNGGAVEQFRIAHTASAVNYLQVTGGVATTGTPAISVQGSDTNISMAYQAKGAGYHYFQGNSSTQFIVAPTASAVNYMQVAGGATGSRPLISFSGSDADVGGTYLAKGAGLHVFAGQGSTVQFAVSPAVSSVNYLQVTGAATGASPSVSAVGTDTNIDLFLVPKGTGVVKFGTHTTNADAAITGYVTIRTADGTTRKLAVIA